MKFQKKTLRFFAAAGMLSLNFVAGCDDTPVPSTPTPSDEQPGKPKAYKWGKLDAALIGGAQNVAALAVSGNGDWLYVNAPQDDKNNLYAGNVSNFEASLKDKASWKKIEYGADRKAEGYDDKIPGKANLHGANKITSMQPAKEGVVVAAGTTSLLQQDQETGAFYVKGDKVVNAWNHAGFIDDLHVPSSSLPGDTLKAGAPIVSFVVSKDDKEYVYMSTRGGNYNIFFGLLGTDKKIEGALKPNFTNPIIAQEANNKPVYVVDQNGLRQFPAAIIGQPIELKGFISAPNFWKVKGKNVDNKYVRAVAAVGDNVFIGLGTEDGTPEDGYGGVVVYNSKDNKLIAPDLTWNKKNVKGFAVDGNTVYAVTAEGLLDVSKADGTFTSLVTTGDEGGELLPKSNITSARFLKGNLLVSTDNKGVFYRLKAEPAK